MENLKIIKIFLDYGMVGSKRNYVFLRKDCEGILLNLLGKVNYLWFMVFL